MNIHTKNIIRALLLSIIILCSCILFSCENSNRESNNVPTIILEQSNATNTPNIAEVYLRLPDDNLYRSVTSEELFTFLEHGTGILMLGYPECPWCQYYMPLLNNVAEEHDIEKIVYYDVKDSRINHPEDYARLLDFLGGEDGYPQYNNDGELRIFVPFVAIVSHGSITFIDNETSDLDANNISPESYWNNEARTKFEEKLDAPLTDIASEMARCRKCDEEIID